MKIRNTQFGWEVECGDELGAKLCAGGGYEKVGGTVKAEKPAPAPVAPKHVEQKRPTTTRRTES